MFVEIPTSKLSVELVMVDLPPDNVAAFMEELIEGGISTGLVFIGESTEDPDDLAVILLRRGEDLISFTFSRDTMETAERARVGAFDLLMHSGLGQ